MNMAASAVNFTNKNQMSSRGPSDNEKMDIWKVLIRDDANRFQKETEDRKVKKKLTQADYKSYLDR